ncbi:hypothetical protein M408DRAFT_75783, partial [Serendipita vermifera MAFF 305830]
KKSLEPKLTPRKVANSSSSTTPSSSLSSRTNEIPRPSLHTKNTSTSSSTPSYHRDTAPFLLKPETPHNPGIIKTAFNDIDDALTNGTLAPLPPSLLQAQEAARKRQATASNAETPDAPTALGGVELTADTGRIWWHKLKEMTKFYFFGVAKLGREHRVLSSELSKRIKAAQGAKNVQVWRDREFVTTYRMDLLRLVPFLSIVIVLEEILPLVIIYAPFLLPSTCKLPAQAKRIEDLADVKRWDSLVALGGVLAVREGADAGREQAFGTAASAIPVLGHESGMREGRLDSLPEGSLQLLCKLLNVAPYGPSSYLKMRLRSTLATLSSEDMHFSDNKSASTPKVSSVDAVSQLSLSELRLLLGRRGFPTTPLALPQLRENLKWWLSQPEHPVERRLEAVLELARWSHRDGAVTGPVKG